jgi:hypothetical protein
LSLHLDKCRVPGSKRRHPGRRVGLLQRFDDFVRSRLQTNVLAERMHYDFPSAIVGVGPGRRVEMLTVHSQSERFIMKTESNDVENLLTSTEAQPQPQPRLPESVDVKSLSAELFQFVGGGSGITSWI